MAFSAFLKSRLIICCIKSGLAPRDQQDVAEEKGAFYPLRSLAKNGRKKGFF